MSWVALPRQRFWRLSVVWLMVVAGLLPLSLVRSANAESSIWDQILIGGSARGGGPWGGRGGFCDVAVFAAFPSGRPPGIVWSEQPVIVWQGSLESAEIRSSDGQLVQRLDLSQVNSDELLHVAQLSETLQPGETYQIVLKLPVVEAFLPVDFRVMPAPERQQIAADLQALAAQGGTAEEVALRQANYFADRQLWADYWQTLLSVEQSSEALKATIETQRKAICEPDETPSSTSSFNKPHP